MEPMPPNLAEAERRIDEARKTHADSLDLGDLALREMPGSLGELPHLRTLYLGSRKPLETGRLQAYRERFNPELESLEGLDRLTGLQHLQLSNTGIQNVAPLAGLHELKTLNLWQTRVSDLSPLAGLLRLQSVDLWYTPVSDLTPLAGLAELQSLNLEFCKGVTDVTPLAGLRRLRYLEIGGTSVTDLAPLAGLHELGELNVWKIPATNLSPLAWLPQLTWLTADQAAGVPPGVLSENRADNCLVRLRAFLSRARPDAAS
jgi:internalin A